MFPFVEKFLLLPISQNFPGTFAFPTGPCNTRTSGRFFRRRDVKAWGAQTDQDQADIKNTYSIPPSKKKVKKITLPNKILQI